jgi:hypothetical protein
MFRSWLEQKLRIIVGSHENFFKIGPLRECLALRLISRLLGKSPSLPEPRTRAFRFQPAESSVK